MKSHTHLTKKLDKKRVIICLLVFFALMPIFSYLHEAGHALVCTADGNEAEISVDILSGGLTLCHGDVSNLFAYKISGGLLAGIEAFADSYFTNGGEWGLFLGFVEFVTFFGLLLVFDRKTVKQND